MRKVVIELTSDELSELIAVLEGSLSKETEILHSASKKTSDGAYTRFLASINRKTELYEKLHKALNRRGFQS